MAGPFLIEVLGPHHVRKEFSCGVKALDRYFLEQVSQDVRRRATACYVALEAATDRVAGYYTLAAAGIPLADMPEPIIKRLPRYPSVPVARLGRLAVDLGYQGRQLGGALLWGMPWVEPCVPKWRFLPWWSMPRTIWPKPFAGTMGSSASVPLQGN